MANSDTVRTAITRLVKGNKFLYRLAMILVGKRPVIATLEKSILGRRNSVVAAGTATFINCRVDIVGHDNTLIIGEFCYFKNITFLIRGDHNTVRISDAVKFRLGGSLHVEDRECLIAIGENSTFEEVHIAATEPRSQIVIGADCMFAYDIDVRTGDSHSIIDTRTNRRINYAGNILIGDHVWVAPHCSILKGVRIGSNCVLATRSVITKSFPRQGVIIGGSPARILKENITWDRRRLEQRNENTPSVFMMPKDEVFFKDGTS